MRNGTTSCPTGHCRRDPALQVWPYPPVRGADSIYFVSGHVPLLFALNLSTDFSVVGAVGATLTTANVHIFEDTTLLTGAATDEIVLARGTAGFDWRLQSVALHPEVTVLRGARYSTTAVIAGIGLAVGALPSYADLGSSDR